MILGILLTMIGLAILGATVTSQLKPKKHDKDDDDKDEDDEDDDDDPADWWKKGRPQ